MLYRKPGPRAKLERVETFALTGLYIEEGNFLSLTYETDNGDKHTLLLTPSDWRRLHRLLHSSAPAMRILAEDISE